MAAEEQEWTVVRGKSTSNRHNRQGIPVQPVMNQPGLPTENTTGFAYAQKKVSRKSTAALSTEQQVDKLLKSVTECKQEVTNSAFYKHLLTVLDQGRLGWSGTHTDQPVSSVSTASTDQLGCSQPAHEVSTNKEMPADFNGVGDSCTQQQGVQYHTTPCLGAVRQLVIYGLGSLENSRVSRYQLALGLLLAQQCPNLTAPPLTYDPAFTPVDCQLLRTLGIDLIEQDEEGRRATTETTLFYLPHCEGWLCENILAANWGLHQLPHLIILGNSFNTYDMRWSTPGAHNSKLQRPRRMLHCCSAGIVNEVRTPELKFPVASAFNDMSLHTFTVRNELQLDVPGATQQHR